MKIGEFIKKYMDKNQINQAELARRSDIPASTISSIINRNNDRVSVEMILKICDILNCDIEEYIDSLRKEQKNQMPSKLKDNLRKLRENSGLSQIDVAKTLGVSTSIYNAYEAGERDLNTSDVICLAKLYDVTTDYLYGTENNNTDYFSYNEKLHIKKYRALDEYGKKAVDSALDIQYERCVKENEQKTIAVEKTYPAELIAHDGINRKTEVTEQDLINAIKADRALRKKP